MMRVILFDDGRLVGRSRAGAGLEVEDDANVRGCLRLSRWQTPDSNPFRKISGKSATNVDYTLVISDSALRMHGLWRQRTPRRI